MKVTITDRSHHALQRSYPPEATTAGQVAEREEQAKIGTGILSMKESWFKGVCILHYAYSTGSPSTLRVECDEFCWLMNFMIAGEVLVAVNGEDIKLSKGHYQTFCANPLDMRLQLNGPVEMLIISLGRGFVRRLLGRSAFMEELDTRGVQLLQMVAAGSFNEQRAGLLIREILTLERSAHFRRIYLEARVLELLARQLEAYPAEGTIRGDHSQEDIARLNEARKIVEDNLRFPCSLRELCRRTGLNEYKLKSGFRSLFGATVFGYLTELRMERAGHLLEAGRSVNEAAEQVGYKNANHFSAAFKKHCGVTPSKFKANKRLN